MNINKLKRRVSEREGGDEELNIAEIGEVFNCINEQLKEDTNLQFDFYGILRSLAEPEE